MMRDCRRMLTGIDGFASRVKNKRKFGAHSVFAVSSLVDQATTVLDVRSSAEPRFLDETPRLWLDPQARILPVSPWPLVYSVSGCSVPDLQHDNWRRSQKWTPGPKEFVLSPRPQPCHQDRRTLPLTSQFRRLSERRWPQLAKDDRVVDT